jgi:hypothetical protein
VERVLPIDGALLSEVLLRLRRDSPASVLRWTLGELGSAEFDVSFASDGGGWTTGARIWNATGMAVTAASLTLEAIRPDEVRLTLEPTSLPVAMTAELAQAAVDELAEELLWHATRAGLTPRG